MQRSPVSYRFLQAVTNPLTGDSVTVGLLHWDGSDLRFAANWRELDHGKADAKRALKAIEHGSKALSTLQLDLFLHDVDKVFPVAEGRGAMLRWAEPRAGQTADPVNHFNRLVVDAGLANSTADAGASPRKVIRSSLVVLADRLSREYPDRVKVEPETSGHYPFKVPIAWKNAVDHFALPVAFEGKIEDQIRSLVGKIQTGIGRKDRAVIVYTPPPDQACAAHLEQELRFLADTTQARHLSVAPSERGRFDMAALEVLVRNDVTALH